MIANQTGCLTGSPLSLRERAAAARREAVEREQHARDEATRQHAARLVEATRRVALDILGVALTPGQITVTLNDRGTLDGAGAEFSADGLDFRVERGVLRTGSYTPEWRLFWVRCCGRCGGEGRYEISRLDMLGAQLEDADTRAVHPHGCPEDLEDDD